ncbi:MAG: class I SAM-dependent methyltransferase [Minisyncoccia bacterium]
MHKGAEEFSFLSPEKIVAAAGVHEGMRVADFHAGAGFVARAAARAVGQSGVVWAVDANRDLLARLKSTAELEGLPSIEIVRGNIERYSGTFLPDESMDIVFLVNALFTCENKDGAVGEAWRVLKKNGRLAVVDWQGSFDGLGPHPTHVVSEPEAKKLLVRGGFLPAEPLPAGAFHWGLLRRKKP